MLWISYLESYYKNEAVDCKNISLKPYTNKLRSMVRQGIPHSLRPHLWMIFSGIIMKKLVKQYLNKYDFLNLGACIKKQTHSITYKEIVRSSNNETLVSSKQIEKDLLRTMPSHVCFNNIQSIGIPRLRRVLRSLAWLYPDIGYIVRFLMF